MRIQQALMAIQRRIEASGDQIRNTLEVIVATPPGSMDKLRSQERIMRGFVELNERARYLSKGSQEDYWCQRSTSLGGELNRQFSESRDAG